MTDRDVTAPHGPARRVDLELLVGWVLLIGVALSVTLIALGVAWHRVATGSLSLDYALPATSVAGFVLADVRQVAALTTGPRRLINLGLAALMLTPYLRVVASLAYFAVPARNWKYTLFTGTVLALLTYTLFH